MLPSRLSAARTPTARLDALCEFIEFWLGPRQEAYGETPNAIAKHKLPMPLHRLYEFAGKWPGFATTDSSDYVVSAFSRQDNLAALEHIAVTDQGKIIFITENQDCWNCRTLPEGDDPPVWCFGDWENDDGTWLTGEKLICNSLSTFLATFILQEMALGARLSLFDETLSAQFELQMSEAAAIWLNAPYVHGMDSNFYLWNGVLVAKLWGDFVFGANRQSAIDFLSEHQGAIRAIGVRFENWNLEVQSDGSATVTRDGMTDNASVKPGTFAFDELREQMTTEIVGGQQSIRLPIAFLFRTGQRSATGQRLGDHEFVTELFRRVFQRSSPPNVILERQFASEWHS